MHTRSLKNLSSGSSSLKQCWPIKHVGQTTLVDENFSYTLVNYYDGDNDWIILCSVVDA